MIGSGVRIVCSLALLTAACPGQSVTELQGLQAPRSLSLSPDGSQLRYKLGQNWWEIGTAPNSKPRRSEAPEAVAADQPAEIKGSPRLASPRRSPDGKRVAYLDAEDANGPLLLFCQCGQHDGGKPRPLFRMPVIAFQWAKDSSALWVMARNVVDEPVGRLSLDGDFVPVSQGAAMRRTGGLAAANDFVAWVQSDGSHFGTLWVAGQSGAARMLFDPNPQTAKWSEAWTQEPVRWKNAHGEELQGILAKPSGAGRFPLIVDPYSAWQNRFLNIGELGNYAFVKAGFAVFFPDHRAAHSFPAQWSIGEAYVGASRDRDPVDVLTDDVMTGIDELVHRGIADPDRLYLYSSSNGASAIDQLLTQTRAFRAAVSHGGVSDLLTYYRAQHALGDDTIPGFLGGRKPEDSPELYSRLSPMYHADRIVTPLLLAVGEKDSIPNGASRYNDANAFYEALRKVGSPVDLVVYPGEGHEISGAAVNEQHVRNALEFFRSAQMATSSQLPR